MSDFRIVVDQVDGRKLEATCDGRSLPIHGGAAPEGRSGFRPTELLLAALGGCSVGTMLSAAEARSIPVDGVHMEVEADSAKHPERVEKIRMVITLPEGIAQDDVESLERVAGHCKVHTTIVRVPEISLEVRVGSPQ